MTTKRQVKKLLQPLLERHPELAVVSSDMGDQVILKPVNHLVRGFHVWRSAYADDPDYFWCVGYTFWPRGSLRGPCGTNFITPDIKMKYWSHPRHDEAFHEVVETDILPLLKSIDTIDRLISFSHPMELRWKHWLDHPMHKLRVYAGLGRLDLAAEAARDILAKGQRRTPWWTEQTYAEVMEQLWPLVEAGDMSALAVLLHDWERQFVEAHGLQAIYEKTPFPFEVKG